MQDIHQVQWMWMMAESSHDLLLDFPLPLLPLPLSLLPLPWPRNSTPPNSQNHVQLAKNVLTPSVELSLPRANDSCLGLVIVVIPGQGALRLSWIWDRLPLTTSFRPRDLLLLFPLLFPLPLPLGAESSSYLPWQVRAFMQRPRLLQPSFYFVRRQQNALEPLPLPLPLPGDSIARQKGACHAFPNTPALH